MVYANGYEGITDKLYNYNFIIGVLKPVALGLEGLDRRCDGVFLVDRGILMNHAGAIASNAGDDFHLIWAAKKIIEMLKLDCDLNTVVVEGTSWEDSVQIEDQTQLYSIDLTEYYGGDCFKSADHIIFSQLKYSAYNLEKEWNLSRICASSDVGNICSLFYRKNQLLWFVGLVLNLRMSIEFSG